MLIKITKFSVQLKSLKKRLARDLLNGDQSTQRSFGRRMLISLTIRITWS